MTLVSHVPKEIRDWYKPATTSLIMDDVRFFTVLFGKFITVS